MYIGAGVLELFGHPPSFRRAYFKGQISHTRRLENQVGAVDEGSREQVYTAIDCNTLHHIATHCNTLQHTATHRNTLQYTAAHCSTLQDWIKADDNKYALKRIATHYNI